MALSPFSIISVDDLRSYGGWTGSGQDENFERACNAASTAVERILGRLLVTRGSQTVYFSVRQTVEDLLLDQYPCKTVTAVYESTSFPRVWDSTTLLTADTHFYLDQQLGSLRRISGGYRTCWARGERVLRVDRTAGYSQPFASADSTGAYTRAEAQADLGELIGLALVIAAGVYKEGDTHAWGDGQSTDAQGTVTRALAYLSKAQQETLMSYARVEFGERKWEIVAA